METSFIFDWMQDGIKIAILLILVTVVPCLVAGLIVAILQAATHVQEQTLTFLPKIIIILLIAIFVGPWMTNVLTQFTIHLFLELPELAQQ